MSNHSPFERRIPQAIGLSVNDRIILNHRKGTFIGYYKMKSWPNVIEWLPDGTLEIEVAIWPPQGVLLDSFSDPDQMDDFDQWSYEMEKE